MNTSILRLLGMFLFTSLLFTSCSDQQNSPLEGSWKLSFEYEIKDGVSTCIFPGSARGSEIKMWAGNRWSLVGVFIEDSVLTDNFGGGTFTLEGNDYKEIVEYHSAPEYLDQTVQLFLEIQGDTLTQIWPVNENGEPDAEHHFMEKWVKMKSAH